MLFIVLVGLTVDYVIHITHAIADAEPQNKEDYNSRINIAMKHMGVGVIKGAWTTFLGAVALVFSQSAAFRTFFYMFSGIIIVACAHGMLFVPAIMGECSFLYSGINQASQEADRIIGNKKEPLPNTLRQHMEDNDISKQARKTEATVTENRMDEPKSLESNQGNHLHVKNNLHDKYIPAGTQTPTKEASFDGFESKDETNTNATNDTDNDAESHKD